MVMSIRGVLPVGARVRVIADDADPLHDSAEVGVVVGLSECPHEKCLVRFDDGREVLWPTRELERVDMW